MLRAETSHNQVAVLLNDIECETMAEKLRRAISYVLWMEENSEDGTISEPSYTLQQLTVGILEDVVYELSDNRIEDSKEYNDIKDTIARLTEDERKTFLRLCYGGNNAKRSQAFRMTSVMLSQFFLKGGVNNGRN